MLEWEENMKGKTNTAEVYSTPQDFYGKIPFREAVGCGLQHVLAMFVGNLTPLIVICGVCGIGAASEFEDIYVHLLQNAMIVAGVVTLVQLYAIGPIGGKVPIIMGTSSGFIGVFSSVANSMGGGLLAYGAIMGASLIGGLFETVLGFFFKPLRKFFPPVVTGTVVLSIGLSLISVGVNSFGGGSSAADFGSMENLFVGAAVLIVILILKHFTKGMLSISSILIGIVFGYILCMIMAAVLPTTGVTAEGVEYTKSWVINWSKVASASWFSMPTFMPVKLVFDWRAIAPVLIMFVVTAVETVGDTSGCIEGGMGREATDAELAGSVTCDGIGSSFAALFGVLPNTSFSQNVGLVTMTKVVNRFALSIGAIFLILCGFFPKLGAIISIMPQSVLGGAAVMMFSSIVVSGIQLITKEPLDTRNTTIVAVALGLGYGMGANSSILSSMPEMVQLIFGGSGIVPAAFVALILNLVLPREKKEAKLNVQTETEKNVKKGAGIKKAAALD
jgi:uracil-xanthine permease